MDEETDKDKEKNKYKELYSVQVYVHLKTATIFLLHNVKFSTSKK